MTKEKKSLFDKAIDALTDRDEKEAAAAKAKAEAEAQAKKVAAQKAATQKAAAEKAAAARAAVAQKAAAAKAAAQKAAAMKQDAQQAAAQRAAAPKKGVVTVRSLRIRADHNTSSEVVAGLVRGDEVTVLDTWSDGKNTWARLDRGWAAMLYDGETYIQVA